MWGCYVALLFALPLFFDVTSSSYCNNNTVENDSLAERFLSEHGVNKYISLYWDSEPSHAASALLAAILRDKIGYKHVKLVHGYHRLSDLARKVPYNSAQKYNEAILALSTAWEPIPRQPQKYLRLTTGIAAPRLYEFGASSVPVRQQLHMHLANEYHLQEECKNVTRWSFYKNTALLKNCGFLSDSDSKNLVMYLTLTSVADYTNTIMRKLEERADIPLKFKTLNRTDLFRMVRNGNQSFLFVDYDMWSGHPNVSQVQPPPCIPASNYTCSQELDTAVPMRVGDVITLREYAPQLYLVAYNFIPTTNVIREILQLESEGLHIQQAACKWVSEHNTSVASWVGDYNASQKIYELTAFHCIGDPDYKKYIRLLRYFNDKLLPSLYGSVLTIRIRTYDVDCSDAYYVKTKLDYYMSNGIRNILIGAVVGGVENVTDVVKRIDGSGLPVLFYDAPGINADATTSTWITSGRTLHLALALHRFCRTMHWTRVGVLSEPTATAKRFIDDLKAVDNSIAFGDHTVQLNLTQSDAETILKKLKEENAYIILVNTNYKDAVTILSAAANLKMNVTNEYAWIVREWRPNKTTLDIHHFTFSFSTVCIEDVPETDGLLPLRKKMGDLWENCKYETDSWPALGTALADAVLTLVHGFNYSIHKNPQIRDDIHSEEAIRSFESSLIAMPIQGVNQNLTYRGHSLEETTVFVTKWYGNRHRSLARWRVNATSRKVHGNEPRNVYLIKKIPHDGTSGCIAYSGDPYLPLCYDVLWGTLLILLVLTPPTIILAYRIVCRRLKEQQKKLICELLAQRQQRAAALSAGYLVDRSALTIFQELGSGRFGFVRLAVLRISGRAPQYVAAKALRDHQEESEILREACTLASLNHDNIIRLVGVCIDKDPPLVLMEVAFFGDLLGYLRDRRYLADGLDHNLIEFEKTDVEACHVSAQALTQLARQAASALGYLSLRGVIHRDLRASNCLVDANRSLKLADFGLARETVATGLDGGAEYACRRRGLFPVLWMAPESLTHGVFSAASDVWALGVLVFELVTLGARPFGNMSPLRVMQFVAAGGKPPMPRDATPQTIGLARLCWQREPEQRPTAADVVAYLAERPSALRPALDCDQDQPADIDSGYGESPLSELLTC